MRRAAKVGVACALTFALTLPSVAFASPGSTWSPDKSSAAPKVDKDRKTSVASVVAPSAADDDFPGVALPASSPFSGTLNEILDVDDVFAVTLTAGDTLSLSFSGSAGTDFDMWVFDSSTEPIHIAGTDTYPENLTFTALYSGVHYIDLYAFEGIGSYSLSYSIVPATRTITNGGVFTGSFGAVNGDGFTSKVHAVNLSPGDRFIAYLDPFAYEAHLCFWGPEVTNRDPFHAPDGFLGGRGEMPNTFVDSKVDFVVPPDGGGTYYLEVGAWDPEEATYTVNWGASAAPSGVHRLSSGSRYGTSQVISASSFDSATTAVLATGTNFADALAASALAGAHGGPLLLTNPNYLSDETLIELGRLGVQDVIVVGGTAAVSAGVFSELEGLGYNVDRIAGGGRYETAKLIADEVVALNGSVDSVFVVRGDSFADALAASPYAYSQGMPVLLTPTASLDSYTKLFIDENNVTDVYIAGGTAAVSSAVATSIDGLNDGATNVTKRFAGAGRYATAVQVAEYAIDHAWADGSYVGIATGLNFPDALGGGAACGTRGGVLLLTDPKSLSTETAAAINGMGAWPEAIAIFGGTGAVSANVHKQVSLLAP